MTEQPGSDGDEHPPYDWMPSNDEGVEWRAVTEEGLCFVIAKREGKRLLRIRRTQDSTLRFICIFERQEETDANDTTD